MYIHLFFFCKLSSQIKSCCPAFTEMSIPGPGVAGAVAFQRCFYVLGLRTGTEMDMALRFGHRSLHPCPQACLCFCFNFSNGNVQAEGREGTGWQDPISWLFPGHQPVTSLLAAPLLVEVLSGCALLSPHTAFDPWHRLSLRTHLEGQGGGTWVGVTTSNLLQVFKGWGIDRGVGRDRSSRTMLALGWPWLELRSHLHFWREGSVPGSLHHVLPSAIS